MNIIQFYWTAQSYFKTQFAKQTKQQESWKQEKQFTNGALTAHCVLTINVPTTIGGSTCGATRISPHGLCPDWIINWLLHKDEMCLCQNQNYVQSLALPCSWCCLFWRHDSSYFPVARAKLHKFSITFSPCKLFVENVTVLLLFPTSTMKSSCKCLVSLCLELLSKLIKTNIDQMSQWFDDVNKKNTFG